MNFCPKLVSFIFLSSKLFFSKWQMAFVYYNVFRVKDYCLTQIYCQFIIKTNFPQHVEFNMIKMLVACTE